MNQTRKAMNMPGSCGQASPLGATVMDGGTNFSLFSRNATSIELLLFDHAGDSRPARTFCIDPTTNRSYHYWHIFVPGVLPGQVYGYRADKQCVVVLYAKERQ